MVSSGEQEIGPGSEPERSRIDRRRLDQDRTLLAMHELEAALGTAAPKREAQWHQRMIQALTALGEATRNEAENASQPDSLLSDIAHNQPRLRNRVRGLRIQYHQLQDRIEALRGELADSDDEALDFADIRQRLAWMLTGLRHQRARESDLIYEAYYDAFGTDLVRDSEAARPDDGQDDGR